MPKSLQNLREQIEQRLPPRVIQLVPGELFVCRNIPLPPDLPRAEIPTFAELSLEQVSPFALEQLGWGYLCHPSSGHLLLYAATFERLRQIGLERLEDDYQDFPSFITLFGRSFAEPTLLIQATPTTLTALRLAASDPVPTAILSRPLPEQALDSDERLLAERDALVRDFAAEGEAIQPGVIMLTGTRLADEELFRFSHCVVLPDGPAESFEHTPPLNGDDVWAADLRPADFARKTRSGRKKGRLAWFSLQWAGRFALLLLATQLFLWGWAVWNGLRAGRASEQAPLAAQIESRQNLSETLRRFAQEEMKPFAMLEVINRGRPTNISFTKVEATAYNTLSVEAKGRNISEVNRYLSSLQSLPQVAEVQQGRTDSGAGGANVEFNVIFSDVPDLPSVLSTATNP